MKQFYFFFIISILLLSSCTTEESSSSKQNPKQTLQTKINSIFKGNTNAETIIEKRGSGYDVVITYSPNKIFKYKSEEADKKSFETYTNTYLKYIFSSGVDVNYVIIKAVERSQKLVANPRGQLHLISQNNDSVVREIAVINITGDEYNMLIDTYEDPQYKIGEYITYHPFFLVELKLKTQKVDIKNLIVGEVYNNATGATTTEIYYEPSNIKTLGDRDQDRLNFEENFANIIRYSFEADPAVSQIRLVAQSDFVDNRTKEGVSTIATYEATREEFEDIMDNWDNYRYRIYEKMDYTDIFLLDLIAGSRILELNKKESEIEVFAFYDKDYTKISKTVDTLQKDAADIIFTIFDYYKNINKITLNFKAKLPAGEGEKTADSVHKIIHDALVLTVLRNQAESINAKNLDNTQIVYNFNPVWDYEILYKNIAENIGSEKPGNNKVLSKNIRSISMPSPIEAVIDIDACDFKEDYFKIVSGRDCRDKCVVERIEKIANNTMYQIHPPFLEKITFTLTRSWLDQAGNEDTEDFGEVEIIKDEDTNYFFQTEESPQWFEAEDDLDIDGDTMCQIS